MTARLDLWRGAVQRDDDNSLLAFHVWADAYCYCRRRRRLNFWDDQFW